MSATIFYLSAEVREAALDLKSVRKKIKESGERGFEWHPAEANARKRMIGLSREQSGDNEKLPGRQSPHPKPGEGFLKLA
jgi:hypothetical protein